MVIKELNIGDRGTVSVIIEKALISTTRTGDTYQKLVVKDSDGTKIDVNNFNISNKKTFLSEKDIINGVFECNEYEGKKSYILKDWEVNSTLNSMDFRPKANIDKKEIWNKITSMIKTIENKQLCQLVCKVLSNNLTKFKVAPLSASDAYARISGLMEATYKLMTLANETAITMNLDRDLMIAAASVYYAGSLDMVDEEFHPTREVALIGYDISAHEKLVEAYNMINNEIDEKNKDKAEPKEEKLDIETFQILENCLLSRWQGKPTATPEAFALKELDSIVIVIDLGNKIIDGLEDGSFVEDRPFNRKWYKKMSKVEDSSLLKEVG